MGNFKLQPAKSFQADEEEEEKEPRGVVYLGGRLKRCVRALSRAPPTRSRPLGATGGLLDPQGPPLGCLDSFWRGLRLSQAAAWARGWEVEATLNQEL